MLIARQNQQRRKSYLLMCCLTLLSVALQYGTTKENDPGVVPGRFMNIEIVVDGQTATATLFDTPTGRDFASLLPLNLTLNDYDDIERISDLPRRLTVTGAADGMIPTAGDITFYSPWGNLAIFTHGRAYARSLIPVGKITSGMPVLQRHGPLRVQIRAEC